MYIHRDTIRFRSTLHRAIPNINPILQTAVFYKRLETQDRMKRTATFARLALVAEHRQVLSRINGWRNTTTRFSSADNNDIPHILKVSILIY